ncbi:uncharacterized protein LOC107519421 isoform X5 [Rousettus aegyptiacus]|uniref:uncharacterized protein LOC107519421 isoform X5 n=1 Tax=Rousettus aegyptiacus TaxID=9407 RepID=UPI00168D375B|nr:uncharacterized protein LOC107519421 isoform X5 [Rousettus aegyptiacus]
MALPFAGSLHESGARRSASGRAQHLWAAGHLPRLLPVGRMPLGAPSHRPHQTGPCKERLGLLRKMTLAFPVVQQGDSDTLWPLTDPGVTVSDSLTWRYMRHFKMLLEKWTLLLETSAELQLST